MTWHRLTPFREKLVMSVEGEVRFDRGTIAIYSHDASNYRQVPIGVVTPRHEDDVIATVNLARERHVPILARGGGTALGGQATCAALVIDFSKYMNRVMSIDPGREVGDRAARASSRARSMPNLRRMASSSRPILRPRIAALSAG